MKTKGEKQAKSRRKNGKERKGEREGKAKKENWIGRRKDGKLITKRREHGRKRRKSAKG